jgi:D-amino-acid dehydrogenase
MSTALVLGGGIVGAAVALALQRAGHATTLLERGEPGMGASFGNAGHIGTASVIPQAVPGIWRNVPRWLLDPTSPLAVRPATLARQLPWFLRFLANSRRPAMERNAAALAALLREVPDAWADTAAEAGAEALFDRGSGLLHVFEGAAALERARWAYDLREALGVRVQQLDAGATRALEPCLVGGVAAGVLLPDVWTVRDPLALTRAVVARFRAIGGEVRIGAATALRQERGRVRAVETGAGMLEPDLLVLCAGAWSAPFARRLGARVPLAAERGYHVAARGGNAPVRQPLMLAERRIVVSPVADGVRLTTMAEFAGPDDPPDHDRAAAAFARAEAVIPGVTEGIAARWMGPRPSTPDGLPVIGRAPRAENAILAYGHGHLGLTLATVTGRLVLDLLAGRSPPAFLAPERLAA